MKYHTQSNKKDKPLNKLQVEDSKQMSLFEIIDNNSKSDYSNSIEVYDALPKYSWDQKEYQDLSNAVLTRECVIRNKKFTVKVKPAIIEKKDGKSVLIYPGQREEIIEDVLRKFASSGRGIIIENKAGVTFTLYEVRKELKKMGRTFSFSEIQEAIQVCRAATLECISDDGKSVISSNFFQMTGLTTKADLKESGDSRCYVQFNPLVNDSILQLNFRQYNYRIGMEIRSPLARFLYKKMSHYFTQASKDNEYNITLINFLSQSPRQLSKMIKENVRAMKMALELLIKHEVIDHYHAHQIKEGRKIIDVNYRITPHQKFTQEVIRSNKAKQTIKLAQVKEVLL